MRKIILILINLFGLYTNYFSQVSVYAKVDHIVPDGVDTQGGISLTVSGSTSPYTYTWNPGAIYTKDISNVSAGQYSLNVKSASNQTVSAIYSLGYKVLWTNLNKCYFRNDTLKSTSGSGTVFSRAVSKNTLTSGTNGWFEYVLDAVPNKLGYVGFLDSISPISNAFTDIDYGIYFYTTGAIYAYENGTNYTLKTSSKVGDVIKVERNGDVISYKINNSTIRTTTVSGGASKVLKLKASLSTGFNIVNLGCSFIEAPCSNFANYSFGFPLIKHLSNSSSNDGSIIYTPDETGTYSYTWQPSGVNSNSITGLSPAQYKLKVKDNNIDMFKYYNVGYKVDWTSLNRCTFSNDSLTSTTTANGLYSRAVSKNTLQTNTDGWMEYVLDIIPSKNGYVGFLDSVSPNSVVSDIDFGFCFTSNGYIQSIESGSLTTLSSAPKIGDVLRLERVGDIVYYKINSVTTKTTTVTGLSSKLLKLKAAISFGASLVNLGCSFVESGSGYFPNYTFGFPLIKHLTNQTSNDGSIKYTPDETGTYSYTWQPTGINSNSLTGVNEGQYRLSINNNNIAMNKYFNMGYKVNWTYLDRCYFRNDTLKSNTNAGALYSRAISKNTLQPNTDGWMEYVLDVLPSKPGCFGFLDSISPNTSVYADIDYGFYFYANGTINISENGISYAYTAAPRIGDVLRVERVGNTINYKLNNVTIRSSTVNNISSKALKLKAALTVGLGLVNFGCSFTEASGGYFPNYIKLNPAISHVSGSGLSDGIVTVNPTLSENYIYSWTETDSNSNTIQNLTTGTNSLAVIDSLGTNNKYSYNVGYKTIWKDVTNGIFRNDTLKGTSTLGTNFLYARSNNLLLKNTDGWFEYVVRSIPGTTYLNIIGFVDTIANSPSISSDIQYGLYSYGAGNLFAYESGTLTRLSLGINIGDILRVERVGNTINYKINGYTFRTITADSISNKAFNLKARLQYKNYLVNIGMSSSSKLGIETSNVSNAENDTLLGQVNLSRISGGLPPYQITWNQAPKIPSNSAVFSFLSVYSGTTTAMDTVKIKRQLDSLRLITTYKNLMPGLYPFKVYDKTNDSINAKAFVGKTIDWAYLNGISSLKKEIKPRYLNGIYNFYGTGEKLTQTGTFALDNCVAIADNYIGNNFNNYIEFVYPDNSYKVNVGLQNRTTNLSSENKTYFEFTGTGTVKIHFLDSVIYVGSASSKELYALSNDTVTGDLSFFRNGLLLLKRQFSRLNPSAGLQLRIAINTSNAFINSVVIVSPIIYSKNGITAQITDATCASECSGILKVTGSTSLFSSPSYYELIDPLTNVVLKTIHYTTGPNQVSFTDLCVGKYKVKYYYNTSFPTVNTYSTLKIFEVGYLPEWTAFGPNTSSSITDHTLTKTGGVSAVQTWVDGASSLNKLSAGKSGWIEWTSEAAVPVPFETAGIGFSTTDAGFNINTINNGIGIVDVFGVRFYLFTTNHLISDYWMSSLTPSFGGPYYTNMKYRLEKDATGVFKFYINGSPVSGASYGPTLLSLSSDYIVDASLQFTGNKIRHPRVSFGCPYVQEFAIPERKLDGGYYTIHEQKLLFKFDEQYNDTDGKLKFNIYNEANSVVYSSVSMGTSSPSIIYGDNRYSIDLSNSAYFVSGQTMPNNKFYILEVINEKNEKWYLRFKK